MPNQRARDQTVIAFALKGELLRGVDEARRKTDQNRSDFIRDAIREEVQRFGIEVPGEAARAPDRARAKRYPEQQPSGFVLHEKAASSKPASAGKAVLRKAISRGSKHSASK